MMQTTQSEAWFQRAKEKMPGGVNSPSACISICWRCTEIYL